ncbi:MAG TPA: alkaline phosphatase family protein [Ktedonosporobacter sp.]|nr:alkaline phosphatase family protein [Ktedonosporobacter sp.]
MQKYLSRLMVKLLVVLLVVGSIAACAQGTAEHTPTKPGVSPQIAIPTPTISASPTPTASPQSKALPTVFLIMMENHNWSQIAGNPSAPYMNNTLLPMASYARAYYNPPRIHPSEPNYLWLEAGTNFGILDDGPPSSHHVASSQHLVTLLQHANISWKSYQEGIDGTVCPLVTAGRYGVKHNPFVFFDDVTGTNNPQSAYCIAHERPYGEFATDLRNNTVAHYNFITPDICDDMHNSCAPSYNPVQQGDSWLAQQIPLILASPSYQQGGVIFITWDEGEGGDGPIGLIALSPHARGKGYSNTIHYTHSSTLRTIEELFGVTPLLGDAANATDLSDLFQQFP